MKNTILIYIFISFISLGCKSVKINNCEEYVTYFNYDDLSVLDNIRNIPNLKSLDSQLLKLYLHNGVDLDNIKSEQMFSLPRNEFFNENNLKGEISLFIIGYVQNSNHKQYLCLESDLNKNSSLYIINQIDNTITSAFLVYSIYNSGFFNQTIETVMVSDNTFQIEVDLTDDTDHNNKNYSNKCYFELEISKEGRIASFPLPHIKTK